MQIDNEKLNQQEQQRKWDNLHDAMEGLADMLGQKEAMALVIESALGIGTQSGSRGRTVYHAEYTNQILAKVFETLAKSKSVGDF